jgi:hypothetical protein
MRSPALSPDKWIRSVFSKSALHQSVKCEYLKVIDTYRHFLIRKNRR